MSDARQSPALRWAWFVLATIALLVAAHMTRYEAEGDGYFWDRWRHRECEAVPGGLDCSGGEGLPDPQEVRGRGDGVT